MSKLNRFPHFTSDDGGMIATEMMERLDALDPDYFEKRPHDRARVLVEEIARQEDVNAALRARLAAAERERDAALRGLAQLREAMKQVSDRAESRSEHTLPTKPSLAHSFTRGMRHAIAEVVRIALTATATDGREEEE
jgi:hypothetical protein